MLNRLARPFVLLLTAALLTGCTTLGSELVAPSLEVTGVQMLSSDMFAQRFKVRVKVVNPSDLELPGRGLEYTILMRGDSFAEGMSTEAFVLPALGEAEFDMLVTTNFVSSFGRLLSRVQGGKLDVKASSDGVTVDGAKVVKTDIVADNGVIHVIDSVVLPK